MNYYVENTKTNNKLDLGSTAIFFEIKQNFKFDVHTIMKSSRYLIDQLGPNPLEISFTVNFIGENINRPLMDVLKEAQTFYKEQFEDTQKLNLFITSLSKFKGFLTDYSTTNMKFTNDGELIRFSLNFSFVGHYADEVTNATASSSAAQAVAASNKIPLQLSLVCSDGGSEVNLGVVPYRLTVSGEQFDEDVSGGAIEKEVYENSTSAILQVYEDGIDKGSTREMKIVFGDLPAEDTIEGAQCRLKNLGFNCGSVDGVLGSKTKKALKRFQEQFQLNEISGKLTSESSNKLKSEQGY